MKGYEYVSYDAKKFYNIVPLVANLLNGGRVCPRAGLLKLSYAVLPKRVLCAYTVRLTSKHWTRIEV